MSSKSGSGKTSKGAATKPEAEATEAAEAPKSKKHDVGAATGPSAKLTAEQGGSLMKIAGGVAALGLALGGAGYASDAHHFAFSYLVGFYWITTIGLGALFFVIVQHVVRAGWSVSPRRAMEWLSSGILPASAVLFAPIVLFAHTLYEHWMGEHAAHDEVLHKKAGYLNPGFFFGRAVVFLVLWTALSLWFAKNSKQQDESGDKSLTERMQLGSAPSILVFGLSTTFAAFDWIMSLTPHWYSTIFGVYVFAGAATSSLSALALITIGLQNAGLLKGVSTIEHRHDIGKLLFGFTVFWAYIAFSQFILIWYANIPEETIYYRDRASGSWLYVSLFLLFGHFIIPFIGLISRTAKRNVKVLAGFAIWMLFMHWVDIYWLVMPTYAAGDVHFSWIDLGGLLLPAGVGALGVVRAATGANAYPVKDPRLAESMRLENA
jgi:hypothetical protein